MGKPASELVLLQRLRQGAVEPRAAIPIERLRVIRRLDVHAQLREELEVMAWWLTHAQKMAG